MPTYEYKCPKCGKTEEHSFKINQEKPIFCLVCTSIRKDYLMQKIISKGTPVHFKGTGFYETDYKGK